MVKEDEPPIVTRIADASKKAKDVVKQWWQLTTSDKRPVPDPSKLVKVKQLPLYGDDMPQKQYVFVEEDPLPLQREFATIRKTFGTEYDRIAEQFQMVDKTVQKSKEALIKTKRYVDEEWTVLPKAAAITVGGMAGFVLGLRRGLIGRSLTTAVGLATMAAFCYPYETVDVVRTGIAHSESAWERFTSSPEPPKLKVDLSPPK
ncbi:MICOS complex subunit [Trichostrongylus colubriformis]|uniref:MICOS complex subunit n=1 Tax=Trichostrongylus colubriformis TaxID=6319 RepID=A0AAN8GEJ1_TRICO